MLARRRYAVSACVSLCGAILALEDIPWRGGVYTLGNPSSPRPTTSISPLQQTLGLRYAVIPVDYVVSS